MRLIDADALKKALMNRLWDDEARVIEIVEEEIDNAPTIEPFEPDYVGAERLKARQRGYEEGYRNGREIGRPKGKWIILDDCEYFMAQCSVCGKIEDSRMVKNYPFCRCGADMRGEEND